MGSDCNTLAFGIVGGCSFAFLFFLWFVHAVVLDGDDARIKKLAEMLGGAEARIADLERSHEFETGKKVRHDFPSRRGANHGS